MKRNVRRDTVASGLTLLLLAALSLGASAQTYESATIAKDGSLRITTSDRRTIVVRKQGQQTALRDPVISNDRTAVGAQADYPNCCTSYDIPLQLVIYRGGRVHRFTGNGLPIFKWRFADDGARVAYAQEPVHFACIVHYELRDVRSERLVDQTDIPVACGQVPNPPATAMPDWAKPLHSSRE